MSEIESKFVIEFSAKQLEAYIVNRDNGWWEKRSDMVALLACEGINFAPHLMIELVGLMHTELSEVVEGARKQDPDTWAEIKKDSVVCEFADLIVRVQDACEYFGLPLAKAIEFVIENNRGRGHMHGGKKA